LRLDLVLHFRGARQKPTTRPRGTAALCAGVTRP
jgi:hypothetical protein